MCIASQTFLHYAFDGVASPGRKGGWGGGGGGGGGGGLSTRVLTNLLHALWQEGSG